jgi:organic radical activating enzyme
MSEDTNELIGSHELYLSDDKIFYTIEGEGEFVGQPSVFMRLSMCNLTCKGFASADSPHGCDSFVSWSIKNKMSFEEILQLMEDSGHKEHLYNGAIFKITGGEPLIQQTKLLRFFDYVFLKWGWYPRIDFETNATIKPSARWINKDIKATFTTSPKLSSNGDPLGKRYIPEVLEWHAAQGSGFKFVIKNESDIDEVLTNYVEKFDIPPGRIWLMPCCGSRQEHSEVSSMVAELAKKYYFNFSPRLQLVIWDLALRV